MDKVLWPWCCSHGEGEHLSVLNQVGVAATLTPQQAAPTLALAIAIGFK